MTTPTDASIWLARLSKRPATIATSDRPHLFCFPHAGGSATMFQNLARAPIQVHGLQILSIQYPGRGARFGDPPCTQLELLARDVAAAIASLDLEGPMGFLGHSFGSIVAFRTAQILAEGWAREPDFFLLGGRAAPQCDPQTAAIHELPEQQFIDALIERYGDPDGLLRDPEIAQLIVPALRADMKALNEWQYRASPKFSSPILAFAGADDHVISPAMLTAWEQHTTGAFETLRLPGGHFLFGGPTPQLVSRVERLFGGQATPAPQPVDLPPSASTPTL